MRRHGFSMVELATVLSISAVLVPIVYRLALGFEDRHALATWHLETATDVRTIAEELRLDARRGDPDEGVAWVVEGCVARYRVTDERVLLRETEEACGGTRGLARNVEMVRRVPGGVEVGFVRALRPEQAHRTTVLIPVGER